MFAATGGEVVANIIAGTASERDPVPAAALILTGWRRHYAVTEQIASHMDARKRTRLPVFQPPRARQRGPRNDQSRPGA